MKKTKTLFSIKSITIGTFIGGWIAGLLMLSYNFKQLGRIEEARKVNLINLISTVLYYILIVIVPSGWVDKLPSVSFPIAYTLIIKMYAEKMLKNEIKKNLDKSKRKSTFIKFISYLFFSITVILLPLIFLTFFQKPSVSGIDCSGFKLNEANRNKKIFLHEEAVCFIHENLQDTNITLNELNEVIYLEGEALENAGIMGGYDKNSLAQTTESQYFDPLPYIIKNKKSNLTENEIVIILEEENKYLEFIGAIK